MTLVVGVRFRDTGKVYFFDPNKLNIKAGDHVIVETARGVECGLVAEANKEVEDDEIVAPLKPVIRIATQADMKTVEENKEKEKSAFDICVKKIEEHKLDM
ncbi:MAG: stage 0 sporulation protein, partial [Eubacterium sp.]|nr:stage 0 sporulation protein [Eubacterium sp.]